MNRYIIVNDQTNRIEAECIEKDLEPDDAAFPSRVDIVEEHKPERLWTFATP